MTRPKPEKPPAIQKRANNLITETRSYRLMTPLYGGGVEPENADSITVVRATEVRGHLRFWWRATRGGAFGGDLDKMRRAEDKIWGSAAGKYKNGKDKPGQSKVTVRILISNKGRSPKSVDTLDNEGLGYAAFPLRDEKGSVEEKVTFTLQFSYPKTLKTDIAAAMWAWETFGGIGARTRRGFGALQRTDNNAPSAPNSQNVRKWLANELNTHVVISDGWPAGVPHLNRNIRYEVTTRKNDGFYAWKSIINTLRRFRQEDARYNKDTGRPDKYGMSYWPEANEVRRLFGRSPALPKGVTKDDLVRKFPRAQFGLPIILHMAHDDGLKKKTITLQGVEKSQSEKYDRLASPLILRPIACSDDAAVGLAVILKGPRTPPGGLILKNAPGNPSVKSDLNKAEANKIPPLNGEPDVLEAFLQYLKKEQN